MNPLPLPVRLAAGLVATAVEQARDLPRLVIEFPVTAVSQGSRAIQCSSGANRNTIPPLASLGSSRSARSGSTAGHPSLRPALEAVT